MEMVATDRKMHDGGISPGQAAMAAARGGTIELAILKCGRCLVCDLDGGGEPAESL